MYKRQVCGGSPHPEKDPDLYDPSWIYLGYGLLRREGLVDEWLEQKKQSYPNSNYVVFTLYESAVLAQPFFVDPPPHTAAAVERERRKLWVDRRGLSNADKPAAP